MERKVMILMLAVILPTLAFSQCRRFTKTKCMPALGEYIPNENFNSAVLIPGDQAELMMTFYAGQDYRVMLCTEDILGDVVYTLVDSDGNKIFASDEQLDDHIDFTMQSTQQLKMTINVPQRENMNQLTHEGCATVLVGYKEKDKGGS